MVIVNVYRFLMILSTKAATKRKKTASGRSRRRPVYGHNQINRFLLGLAGLATLCIAIFLTWFLHLDIPDIRSFEDYHPLVATRILDRHGRLADVICKEFRIVIPYHEMPPLLPAAFVAAEDSRFFEHAGLDFLSILRAAINNLRSGRRSQGGSTLTQQVTRALMLTREKTYWRKLTEAILAYRLDTLLSKEEILAIYLNEIYLGEGAYGVEAAARTYFSKSARNLNLAEIALLAGLPQSPSRYSPVKHRAAARARQRYVLNRMAEDGIISPEQARRAYDQKIALRISRRGQAGSFTDYVRERLRTRFTANELFRQGLTVWTTLDPVLQRRAGQALQRGMRLIGKRHPDAPLPEAALVAIDPATGAIRAMAGGRDHRASDFNRAVHARRQPGSAFKPFVYAAAFEQGFQADSRFEDSPLTIRNPDGTVWKPHNASRRFNGTMTLRQALVHSNNIVTIRLLRATGLQPVLRLARQAGIHSRLKAELPLALGASPLTLLELTSAYTIFAADGLGHPPRAITRIRDSRGDSSLWQPENPTRVISRKTARLITDILKQAVREGTGKMARGIPGAAGKTGTSDDYRDAWFIGYTKNLVAGVWVGHDRGRTLGTGESGGRAAAPVWKMFMERHDAR